jgi:sensor histidine kinase YesM
MKTPGAGLLGDEGRFPLEQRIFHMVMLMGMILTAFGAVLDAVYDAPVWVDILFLFCWAVLYGVSRYGRGFRTVSVIAAAALVFAFVPYQWILSSGTASALPDYTVLFIVTVCIMLRGWRRFLMAASMLAVVVALVGYDAFISGTIPGGFWTWAVQLAAILIATALLMIFYSNAYVKEKRLSDSYAQTIEAHVRQQVYYVENLEQLIEKLKSERHDFNNHLGVIHGLLSAGEADKAKAYAAKLVKEAAEYQNIANVPYPAQRALLNHKLSAARDSGIALKLDIGLPEGLVLNEFDLTVILGNLLDNAAEACAVAARPSIELSLRYKPEYLVLHVANPFDPSHHAPKTDPENHGFGLKNVEYFVGKRDGFMEIKRDGGVFTVDIALPVG